MSKLINISINLSKIDKAKIIDGKKGKYIDITINLDDKKDQFGNDCSAWQGQTKEERQAKHERNYLGNGRIIWQSSGNEQGTEEAETVLPF